LSEATLGTPETLLLRTENAVHPSQWSRDGRFLLYTEEHPQTNADIGYLPVPGAPGTPAKPVRLLATDANETMPQLSPDGKWLAFVSDQTGDYEVYVCDFHSGRAPVKVSISGGTEPRWSMDGRELFYLAPIKPRGTGLMAASVRPMRSERFESGPSRQISGALNYRRGFPLFNRYSYDVAPDGRFLFSLEAERSKPPTLDILTNWQSIAERAATGPH
jgi:Tol biopolymer transport system component